MGLGGIGSGRTRRGADDVNITPVMNLFLVLVPFLLLSTEFVRLAVLELSLPSQSQSSSKQDKPQQDPVLILLAIDDNGYELKAPRMSVPKIPKLNGEFNVEKLSQALSQIKARYQATEEITIQPAEAVIYEVIVDVMDACRDSGFPNISVSG